MMVDLFLHLAILKEMAIQLGQKYQTATVYHALIHSINDVLVFVEIIFKMNA